MQNNSNKYKKNTIKLASFSALLLACICLYPQEELTSTVAANNEKTITVTDEVFKVQSARTIDNIDVSSASFDEEEKENISALVLEKVKDIFFN